MRKLPFSRLVRVRGRGFVRQREETMLTLALDSEFACARARTQVREVTEQVTNKSDLRFQAQAILCLQEAAEAYLVLLFEDAYVAWSCRSNAPLIRNTLVWVT